MKLLTLCLLTILLVFFAGCSDCEKTATDQKEECVDLQAKADKFLGEYQAGYARVDSQKNLAEWKASTVGSKEAYDQFAAGELALKQMHSDKERFKKLQELLAQKDKLKPMTVRALSLAELEFKENQLPKDLLEKIVTNETEIKKVFNNFRGKLDGKEYSNNQLLGMLEKENDSLKRKKIWETLKQVGAVVAPKLVALAKVRNEAAKKLGYQNFWDMKVRLKEFDPAQLIKIFDELEQTSSEPFKQVKARMDVEQAARFKVKPEEIMPWHYGNPFFQEPSASPDVDLDEFYKDKSKEDIVELGKKFMADIGLPVEDILARSDLYERPGKDQHAFCTDIDRKGDVRILVNVKPNAYWMDTVLHELGHAVYDKYLAPNLPYNIRSAASAFTTEAIAKLFGALAKNPAWMVTYAGADPKRVQEVEKAILEQMKREQLMFARWSLVMVNFEKALYDNPEQDLNTLWWDMVERYQMLKRPAQRNSPDWAAKPHFTIAAAYYHSYQLGELLAAQLRAAMVKAVKHEGPANTLKYNEHKNLGEFLVNNVFKPGKTDHWSKFIEKATGEPLTARYFSEESK